MKAAGVFAKLRLFDHFVPLVETGLVADVDRDGVPDFVSVDKQGRLIRYRGTSEGRFPDPPEIAAEIEAEQTLALTAGDVDQDGDLDLFVTQYIPSYLEGQMPTPYYDANDGELAYLLINDGTGNFRDQTETAGLGPHRRRRTYSTSFFDFDDDGDQDLMVVSDYAGVDLYRNQGRGRFVDVTSEQLPEHHLFGMAHTLADFDGDGKTDIYAIGMSSTTARRLDRLGLGREDRPDVHAMRAAMGYGNRMFLRRGDRFVTPGFAPQVARTGWSWGTTSFDFDLDGDRDIYVANGFRSGQSCQDYCTTFWRHDIYTGSSKPDPQLKAFFSETMRELDQGRISWNGYEHNSLLMNRNGQEFVNIGFLLGVAFQYDSRSVVGGDLDGDGRPDLIVAEYRFVGRGFELELHVYQNILPTGNHWVGFHLQSGRPGRTPIGAKVKLTTATGTQLGRVVTGDSFLAQHPATVHFGLGQETEVLRAEITWPDGQRDQMDAPAIDTYHTVGK